MIWPLIFISGLMGSAHCIGMCGGFALMLGWGASNWRSNLPRQLVYSSGRIFTYAVFGAVAGAVGTKLTQSGWININPLALLSILAGCWLIREGLYATGLLQRDYSQANQHNGSACVTGKFLTTFLKSPELTNVFLAGMLTGFLPCGLVYGFVALAAATGDLLQGIAVMALFGLGTVPIMVLTGLGASSLSVAARQRLFRVAAYCLLLTGVMTVGRGAGLLYAQETDQAGCPLCREQPTQQRVNHTQ